MDGVFIAVRQVWGSFVASGYGCNNPNACRSRTASVQSQSAKSVVHGSRAKHQVKTDVRQEAGPHVRKHPLMTMATPVIHQSG